MNETAGPQGRNHHLKGPGASQDRLDAATAASADEADEEVDVVDAPTFDFLMEDAFD
jgi:hypothetical protein